eukprot:CAMPEP_0184492686 /NCGR_PEP_ID=MMETSP0113_2-20130426/23985_1 /TAXON_ID=91329 /ORGANISM="Norrisiella sphaerica, Strain BC52" /LENGTH=427 /DNA_ID=CAMNT_0026877627 /DNA_START=253 /DNA_END=1536 /DNA_ORIENTATION=+
MRALRRFRLNVLWSTRRRPLSTTTNFSLSKNNLPSLAEAKYVTELLNHDPSQDPIIPSYRVLDELGNLLTTKQEYHLDPHAVVEMYKTMAEVEAIDHIFMQSQRHGRISFYMQNSGEEGLQVGSAAALSERDHIFSQYRELGVFLWRGFDMQQVAHQCFSNVHDLGKGRQMPMHFGSHKLNMYTISSPLATQLPQASGVAYVLKRRRENACVACYFGDGAASEGDFHAALNFAATLECPVIFFCRNNGWAISTPTDEQYRGDGILSRAAGYGMRGIRVDGNDMLAVFEATKAARNYAVTQSRPIIIEAMTYRRGHHSSSDDSNSYRETEELQWWRDNNDPVSRVRRYLESQQLWDSDQEADLRQSMKKKVKKCMSSAERAQKPPVEALFTDVYAEMPKRLEEQQQDLKRHLKKYASNYDTKDFHVSP